MPIFGLFGPPNVEKLKIQGNVQSLIRALGYKKDAQIRQTAAQALGEIGDWQAVEPLISASKDENRDVRQAATQAVTQIIEELKIQGNVQDLMKALGYKEDAQIRQAAAQALGEIGDWQAVEPLISASEDENKDVCQAATQALTQVRVRNFIRGGSVSLYDVNNLVKIGDVVIEPLLAAFGQYNFTIEKRNSVLTILTEIGDDAFEPLLAIINNQDYHFYAQEVAAEVLGQLGDTRAVEPLVAALKDEDYHVRSAAAKALGQLGDTRAVEPLVAALKDEDYHVRSAAAEALGQLGDTRTVEPLVAALKDEDYHVRSAAAEALGQLDGTHAVEPLVAALKDKVGSVRRAAARALKARAWQPTDNVQHAYWVVASQEWKQVAGLGTAAVKPLALELLETDTVFDEDIRGTRRKAAEALGQLGDTRAVEPLVAALKDKDGRVRREAAEALKALAWQPLDDGERALQALAFIENKTQYIAGTHLGPSLYDVTRYEAAAVEALIVALTGTGDEIRKSAESALTNYKDPLTTEMLVGPLETSNWQVRSSIVRVLSEIGDAQAVELLIAALKDDHKEVQGAAVDGLGKLNNPSAVAPLLTRASDYDLGQNVIMALEQILRSNADKVEPTDLQTIADLHDVYQIRIVYPNPDCPYSDKVAKEVDCAQIQQLARQELIRRGLQT